MAECIYLDHNATTPTRAEVVEAMARCQAAGYANPASQHQLGQRARRVLEEARERIAELLGARLNCPQADRLIFTSGGTEANNLAILGMAAAGQEETGASGDDDAARQAEQPGLATSPSAEPPNPQIPKSLNPQGAPRPPRQLVVSAIEHASVLEPAEHLMEQGWRLDTLGVDPSGVVLVERLAPLFGAQTRLVSVIMGSHETGVLQPIGQLAAICRSAGVPLHTDAVAVAGKLPIDFRGLGVAALSVTAHKFQGPLGIGALVLRHDVPLAPLLFGGHQQHGLRPGTESVALAVGVQTALELWHAGHAEHARRVTALRERFEAGVRAGYPEAVVHGHRAARLPNTSNIALPGLDGQILLLALDLAGVACSVGAACASGSSELSPTLRAMGLPNDLVASSLRFSLGATTTAAEVDEAARRIGRVCRELRGGRS